MVIKTRTGIIILLFSFLYLACSKSGGDGNPPGSTVIQDTLSAGWSKPLFSANSAAFSDVFFANALTGYAVNEEGILRSTDGGVNWTMIYRGQGFVNIAARGQNACFVNMSDTIYFTTDGGVTLQKKKYASSPWTYPYGFTDVFYTPGGKCYAVSSKDLFRSLDGGANFDSLFSFPSHSYPVLSTISFLDEQEGWVVRNNGIYRTVNGGPFWELYNRPVPFPALILSYYSLAMGYVTTNNAVYKTTDNGNSWQNVFSGAVNGGQYVDIAIINDQVAYFCLGNRVYRTNNGGAQWTVVAALGQGTLIELHFVDANTGWACGDNGTIMRFKQ